MTSLSSMKVYVDAVDNTDGSVTGTATEMVFTARSSYFGFRRLEETDSWFDGIIDEVLLLPYGASEHHLRRLLVGLWPFLVR